MRIADDHRLPAVTLTLGLILMALALGCERRPDRSDDQRQPAIAAASLTTSGPDGEMLRLSAPIPGMTFARVREVPLSSVLEITGQVAFDDRRVANIVSRVAGPIEQTHVSQWDFVQRGQSIVTLYSPDYMTTEAEYLQALQTTSTLARGGRPNAEFAQSLVDAARRKLELLGIDTAQIAEIKTAAPVFTMRAPISGTIVQNQALRGSAVNPGDVLYYLGGLDDVWITGNIFEADLARVHVGQRLEARTIAFPKAVFTGVVDRISPNIDANTHTLQLRCTVSNPHLELKPQMLATIRISAAPADAVIVPQMALVFDDNAYYAFVEVAHDWFERRPVAIASWSEQGYARVISGLTAGPKGSRGAVASD